MWSLNCPQLYNIHVIIINITVTCACTTGILICTRRPKSTFQYNNRYIVLNLLNSTLYVLTLFVLLTSAPFCNRMFTVSSSPLYAT